MVTLLILDGFGLSNKKEGNAVAIAKTPNLDNLNQYPHTKLDASGEAVGLIPNQMGNSEVGHLNLGAGRIVYQDLPKINNEIRTGEIKNNKAFLEVIDHVKKNRSALHIMGLVSDGGVHSHISHLKAIIDLANEKGVNNVFIHAFMDGRDTFRDSGAEFIDNLLSYAKGKAKLASLTGRVYAMDRENRWDRIEKTYNMLVLGRADKFCDNPVKYLKECYSNNVFDEFIEPTKTQDFESMKNNDGIIFFNYRTDRARELTQAISQTNFNGFVRDKLQNICYCCMTEYSKDFSDVLVAYPPENISDNLSAIISQAGMNQFHVTETTKYAHVTFFFNGGIESPYPCEDRMLIDSYNVKNFADFPQMKAPEITEACIEAINSKKYDFILVNLSNPDMIGHTGDLDAAIKAIEVVDDCAGKIANACIEAGGDCIITADHGNAEEMIDAEGNVITSHTTNKVPLWLVSEKYRNVKLKEGVLANVAPTVLKLLEVKKPSNMIEPLF